MNHHHSEEIDVPPFFLCPISLQIMKDPVTISTGITYDRETIETWVYTNNNKTCPVTKQALNIEITDTFLTPNHTLRRLIQSWCTLNASYGVERFPTPKSPITRAQILKLINNASSSFYNTTQLLKCVTEMKSIALESNANKRCLETTPGVYKFLVRVIVLGENNEDSNNHSLWSTSASEEALKLLAQFEKFDELLLKKSFKEKEEGLVNSLIKIMQKSSYESRAYAIELLKQFLEVADPTQMSALKREHFVELVQLIKDEISPKATKDTLKALALACPWGRNRVQISDAGSVPILVDLLVYTKDKRISEMVLVVLEHLSGCAEGRAELLGHGTGLAVVSKKILRVSHLATEKGVRILLALSRFSGSTSVVKEMLELGVVTKLCLVLQVDCEVKTKDKAREILKLHARAWRNSPCAPSHIFGSFD